MNAATTSAFELLLKDWPPILQAWGFTRTAGLIHAALLGMPESATTDELLALTSVSRGGLSTQLQALVDAGLVERLTIVGQRKTRYKAIRDPQDIRLALQRQHHERSWGPMLEMTRTLTSIADKHDLAWLMILATLQNEGQEWSTR